MNHWRQPSLSLTWAAQSQTPTLQTWKWKGGSNPSWRPMVRYKRDSGAVTTSAQKPKWRFSQLQSSLACSIPSSAPLLYRRHIMALTRLHPQHQVARPYPRCWGTVLCSHSHCWSPNNVSQLCWAGHEHRMANSRLPKAVSYSELRQGKRSHGGQKIIAFQRCLETAREENRHLEWYLRGEGRASKNISVHMSEDTQQLLQAVSNTTIILSALLQIPSRSDCPHESLFKIGLNSNTRQSSSAMKDSHYIITRCFYSPCFKKDPKVHHIIWQSTDIPPTVNWYSTNNQSSQCIDQVSAAILTKKRLMVDISTNTWPISQPMYRPIYHSVCQLTYLGWYIDWYIGWVSVNMSTGISTEGYTNYTRSEKFK